MLWFPVPLLDHHKVEQTADRPTRVLVILSLVTTRSHGRPACRHEGQSVLFFSSEPSLGADVALLRSNAQCHEVAEVAWLTLWLPAPWLLWEDPCPDAHHWPLCLYLGRALSFTFCCLLQTNQRNRLAAVQEEEKF